MIKLLYSHRPKYLIFASFGPSLTNFRYHFIKKLLVKGFDVHVAAPVQSFGFSDVKSLNDMNVTVHNLYLDRNKKNILLDIFSLLSFAKIIYKVKPSFLLAYTHKPIIYGLLVSNFFKIEHKFALITGLGFVFTSKNKFLSFLVSFLYKITLQKCSRVFFQNHDDVSDFKKMGILNSVPFTVVNGSGVDLNVFNVVSLPSTLTFIFIGRFLGNKGIREFAEAAKLVLSSHCDVKFLLVGWLDDNPDSIAEDELTSWVSNGTLQLLGHLNDVKPAIAISSVLVLPSYREGTPRSVLEAMAMGRPIITTDAPGCRETVIDGDNGFLVPVRSVNALADAMLRFAQSPSLVNKMGARSRQIAVDKYDVNKVNLIMLREMRLS